MKKKDDKAIALRLARFFDRHAERVRCDGCAERSRRIAAKLRGKAKEDKKNGA